MTADPGMRAHWPEYLMEAAELGFFMFAACAVVIALEHPNLPFAALLPDAALRRAAIGVAMGLTAVAIIYSPWGEQSGAHFNPAVTLTYFALGKIEARDALGYAIAQFAGAIAGMTIAVAAFDELLDHPAVAYVATRPGSNGAAVAFAAELSISFLLMSMVLWLSRRPAYARYTGVCAGIAVAAFISIEAPTSGMSMNPARSLGPAVVGRIWDDLWIYFIAPPFGMLAAAAASRLGGRDTPHCAKLNHGNRRRCIFCGAPGRHRRVPARLARAAALLVCLATFATPRVATADDASHAVEAVEVVSLTVSDAERSTAFFRDVLDFEVVADDELWGSGWEHLQGLFGLRMRVVRLRLGDESIEIVEYLTPTGRPLPVDSRSHDRWFQHVAIIVSDIDRAFAHLRSHRVRLASPAPQTLPDWNVAAAGIRALYFKDPDGHALEVLQFPAGKGDPKWQQRDGALFLGIDHTAIVVADTDASLALYRDVLGLRVAGESENYGTEQEHLNNVFGARLRITALRASRGPGIELLEYLTPGDGRPIPGDQAANDIAHWETGVVVPSADAAAAQLRQRRASFVSPGVVEVPEHALGFSRAFLVRDPDGHVLRVTE